MPGNEHDEIHVLIHVVNLIDLKPQTNQFESRSVCEHTHDGAWKKCIDPFGFIAKSEFIIGKLNVTSDSIFVR